VREETPDRVVVVKPNYGSLGVHVLLFLLSFWWSFGAVNLAYGLWNYVNDSPRRGAERPARDELPELRDDRRGGRQLLPELRSHVRGAGGGVDRIRGRVGVDLGHATP
jgi:hypothetical protein